jgi:hypothetical protein
MGGHSTPVLAPSQTTLLREVLSQPQYHVLHFDLRIAGFADLSSLYTSLSAQIEQYFVDIANTMEGYEEFEREAWSFKVRHCQIDYDDLSECSLIARSYQCAKPYRLS